MSLFFMAALIIAHISSFVKMIYGVFVRFVYCDILWSDMSDFEQEFRSKVQGGETQPVGGVVPNDYVEKKQLDKRWFLIGGLVLALVVMLVVLNVIGGGRSTSGGGEESIEEAIMGEWDCEDGSGILFSSDGSVAWSYPAGTIRDEYRVHDNSVEFGAVAAEYGNDGRLSISMDERALTSCERSGNG